MSRGSTHRCPGQLPRCLRTLLIAPWLRAGALTHPLSPQLFYLCVEVYQQTHPKDSRSLGKDIWTIFLEKNAVRQARAGHGRVVLVGPLGGRGRTE